MKVHSKKTSFSFLIKLFVFLFLTSQYSFSQCDTIANFCQKHLINTHITDGQEYRALLLNNEETAEFKTTFFGETNYRIAACSGLSDNNLIFSIYDENRNLLFTNKDFKNAPYWDFQIKNTLDVTIEAKLLQSNNKSGCAVLLIGFKNIFGK